MATVRRLGDPDSATAHAIMDGAELVLQERGYGAITSRSVAEEAGVKHQLVYYYFQDADALLLAACKRRMDSGIARLHEGAKSDRPIRAIWDDFTHAISAWLDFEYMALANRHDGVRRYSSSSWPRRGTSTSASSSGPIAIRALAKVPYRPRRWLS